MKRYLVGLVLAATAMPIPAFACPPPLAPPRLPGEPDKAYEERSSANIGAQTAEGQRAYQVQLGEQAERIFIGTVQASREIDLADGSKGHEVDVRPVRALKGVLPKKAATLRDGAVTECGNLGGGSATGAAPGDYVIVFEGVDTGFVPNTGKVGIFVSEARDPLLIKSLFEAGAEATPPGN
jgi:hypothetical protein